MIYQNIDEYMTYISQKCLYQSTHWISKTVKTLNNAIYTSIKMKPGNVKPET